MTTVQEERIYDFSGLNIKNTNALKHGFTQEEIDDANKFADFFHDKLGVEVIPCDSKQKGLWLLNEYKGYYNEEVPKEFFNHWKETGAFVYGIAVLCGKIRRGEYRNCYFNMIDADNKKGVESMMKITGTKNVEQIYKSTLVESYEKSGYKVHVYLITFDKPLVTKNPNTDDSDELPKIEVYGDHHAAIVSNSWKYNSGGQLRQVVIRGEKNIENFNVYTDIIKFDNKQRERFETALDNELRTFGLKYLDDSNKNNKFKQGKSSSSKFIEDMKDENFKVYSGGNKQQYLLSKMESLIARNYPTTPLPIIKKWSEDFNLNFIDPPIKEREFNYKWKKAIAFIEKQKEYDYDDGTIKLLRELDELGVIPDKNINEERLPAYVKDLKNIIYDYEDKAGIKVTDIEIETATDRLMGNHIFKTLSDTREILIYNDKIYEKNGEIKILQELEQISSEERKRLKRLEEIGHILTDKIAEGRKQGKNTFELEKYHYALAESIYKSRKNQIKVRKNTGNEVIHKIGTRTFIDRRDFKVDPNRIIVNNGILQLETKKVKRKIDIKNEVEELSWTLKEHSPEVLSLNMFSVNYNPKATCPNFIRFLNQICKYNPRLYVNIIKMLGYCIYQSCEYQCAFLLWGDGDNGKSIILKVIQALVGLDNVSAVALHDLCDGDKFYPAQLFGKTVNIYADLPFQKIKNTSKFKASVAGDLIEGQFKNQNSFYFEPYAKQLYSTNRISKSDDDTYGWFKRWVLLHFKVRIEKELQDKELVKKLTTAEELSGVLNLALTGLRLLKRDGGFEVGSIQEIKREYEKQSNLVKEFVAENYQVDIGNESPEYSVSSERVQTEFINWLKEDNGSRQQYLKNEITNSGSEGRDMDLDNNEMDRWIVCGLLGRELVSTGIDHRRKRDYKNKEYSYYYTGLKARFSFTGIPLDGFQKSVGKDN